MKSLVILLLCVAPLVGGLLWMGLTLKQLGQGLFWIVAVTLVMCAPMLMAAHGNKDD